MVRAATVLILVFMAGGSFCAAAAPMLFHGTAAQAGSAVSPLAASSVATLPRSSSSVPATLAPIVVTAANTEPHIWIFQKGNSKVLVLGTIYPEPKGLDFIPFSIDRAIKESGAVIGPPWFNFDVHVGLFGMFKVWRESRDVTYLPDGKHLADVVPPELLARWKILKANYLPHDSKVDGMLPMYAGWKLYDAVLDHSGVAVDASIPKLVKREAKQRGMKITDASFHWTIQDPTKAAKAFTPDPQADLVCFNTILEGIQGLPDASRTLAAAWARGDVATMRTYLEAHPLTPACWRNLTDDALAKEQGIDLAARKRDAWITAVNAAAALHPVIFTTAPVQDIFNRSGRIGWLLADGYSKVSGAASLVNSATAGSAAGARTSPQPTKGTGG